MYICQYSKSSLLSYVTKENNCVLLLSNINSTKIVPLTAKKHRPTIILDYNAHKGGVDDNLDQILYEYRIYRAIRRWPAVIFFDLLGFSCHASWVIYSIKFPKDPLTVSKNRREFIYLLGKELVAPLVEKRRTSTKFQFLPHSLKKFIESANPPSASIDAHTIPSPVIDTIAIPSPSIDTITMLSPSVDTIAMPSPHIDTIIIPPSIDRMATPSF